jgi:3-hydroxy-9,10-secoandrosta-1,3,5(10)-triene-9,17-dione monooxygenase
MFTISDHIETLSQTLAEQALINEELGCLSPTTQDAIRTAGVMRMLQPKEYGGAEAHPVDFFETAMEIGSHYGSAGWVTGVVGVHAWELAQADPRLQAEVWGEDAPLGNDTWVASPYAPMGRAIPVEGGYRFSGRWPFSSGTDGCQWIVLGGMVADENGEALKPPVVKHFFLPRSDYEIDHDSWNVMGLKGTGSKDIIITDAFIPDYRVLDQEFIYSGGAAAAQRPGSSLYAMPFGSMFPAAITSATIGIAEGALAAFIGYTQNRKAAPSTQSDGNAKLGLNAHHLVAIGEASADIQASRLHTLADVNRLYDVLDSGQEITTAMRIEVRRNQVRASRRAVAAIDLLMDSAGGSSLKLDQPLQRAWRDGHAALAHVLNTPAPVYEAYGFHYFGGQVPPGRMH